MSALREELHHLVDELPEERLSRVLQLLRGDSRKAKAIAALEAIQERVNGVTGINEKLSLLRDGGRSAADIAASDGLRTADAAGRSTAAPATSPSEAAATKTAKRRGPEPRGRG